MSNRGVGPLILNAWLSARSIARRLPSPVPEYGGFRVDTKSDAEVARWVFPRIGSGLEELARSISEPRYFLKLCGATTEPPARRLADGYRIKTKRVGMVMEAKIFAETGALAASGYAAETRDVFIYDRIVTEPEHRRKGLGHALMLTLHAARQHPSSPELLVATEDGRALYSTLGWETISPYSTASIIDSLAI